MRSYDLFELVRVLDVQPDQQRRSGLSESSGRRRGGPICDAVWQESSSSAHQLLVLRCEDGNLLLRFDPCGEGAVEGEGQECVRLKQVKWFVSPQRAVCCMVLDARAEWLVCGCRDASIALVPVHTLLTGRSSQLPQLSSDDITIIQPLDDRAAPTRVIWWETMGGRSIIISASAGGELVFTDLILRRDVTKTSVHCVVSSMKLIVNKRLSTTHLLIGASDGRWFRMLLEFDSHDLAASHGFDIIAGVSDTGHALYPDPGQAIDNVLHRSDVQQPFLPKLMQVPTGASVTVQERGSQTFMAVHSMVNNTLQLFDADVELQGKPLYSYNLVASTSDLVVTDLMMFGLQHSQRPSLCHTPTSELSDSLRHLTSSWSPIQLAEEYGDENESSPAAVLNVLSMQFASPGGQLSPPSRTVSNSELAVQRFQFPDGERPLALYACSASSGSDESPMLSYNGTVAASPSALSMTASRIPGCVVVTTHGLYHCMQKNDPESMFLDLLSGRNCDTTDADCLGVMMKLDVCKLYHVAADEKLQDGLVAEAMKYFQLSKCSHVSLVNRLAASQHMGAALDYLRKVIKSDSTGPGSKQLSDLLFQCYLHQLLTSKNNAEQQASLLSQLGRFITDNFNYDPMEAMTALADHGLADLVLEIAHTRGLMADGFQLLLQRCHLEISPSSCSALIDRGSAHGLAAFQDGVFLRCLQHATIIQFVLADLDKLSQHIPLITSLLPRLDHSILLRLARVLDPSRSIIRPLLAKKKPKLARQGSMTSLRSFSSVSSAISDSSFSQQDSWRTAGEAYVELFLAVLLLLRQRRAGSNVSETAFIMSGIDEEISRHLARQRSETFGNRRKRKPQLAVTHSKHRLSQLVACGELHAAAVSNGALYTWGKTKDGRLGHGDIIEEEGRVPPFRVEILHMHGIQVLAVDCGCEHTVSLCQDGVYAWGSSDYGQLGLGDRNRRTRPSVITELSDKRIKSVVCGQYHCIAVSRDHHVYSWGWGVHGQLGLSSCEDSVVPVRIAKLDKYRVKAVSAGYGHSAVLSHDGVMLTFGNNQYGQLGLGHNVKQSTPHCVEALEKEKISHIACGNFFTVAITEHCDIYQWGRNLLATHPGQLKSHVWSRQNISELINSNHNVPRMVQCGFEGKVRQIVCGSCHGLLLTDSFHLYSWGANDYGELGIGSKNNQMTPKMVSALNDRRVVSMAAGDQFSVALDQFGEVWVWGRGERGQLGIEASRFPPNNTDVEEPTPLHGLAQTNAAAGGQDMANLGVSAAAFGFNVSDTEDDHDVEFDLPELATFGGVPYGDQALKICLEHLRGYYSVLKFLRLCMDWQQWQSAADMCDLLQLWPMAFDSRLQHLAACKLSTAETQNEVQVLFEKYLSDVLTDAVDSALDHQLLTEMVLALVSFWQKSSLPPANVEAALRRHLAVLAEPLSSLIVSDKPVAAVSGSPASLEDAERTVRFRSAYKMLKELSPAFHMQVVSQTVKQITSAGPMSLAISSYKARHTNDPLAMRSVPFSAPGRNVEQSLWNDVLQHLSKNLEQNPSINVPPSALDSAILASQVSMTASTASFGSGTSSLFASRRSSTSSLHEPGGPSPPPHVATSPTSLSGIASSSPENGDMVVFSCGHSFPRKNFDDRIVPEFRHLLSSLPLPLKNSASQLRGHYLESPHLVAACPLCVYDYLRQVQQENDAIQ